MIKGFWDRTWALFVAVGVIAVSSAVLLASISANQGAGIQRAPDSTAAVEHLDTPVASLAPAQAASADDQEIPVYLLTLDESAKTLPQAKDLGADEAAAIAARTVIRLFDADLEGEICGAMYLSGLGANLDNRWDAWSISFGDWTQGTYGYEVMMNAVSGEVVSVTKQFSGTGGEAGPRELDAAEKSEFAEQSVSRARQLAQQYFLNGYAVGGMEYGSIEQVGYDTDIGYVGVFPDGGGPGVRFGFCMRYGGLVSVERADEPGDMEEQATANKEQ